ncbi:MAG: hypothetical protein GC181_15995 [Bacteroidetes bacterium]|nr:hypothetical protein [Bacteroidota bacterium]
MDGKQILYVHSEYESIYEKELEFTFESGILKQQLTFDNSRSFRSVFTENPDSLFRFLYSRMRWQNIPDLHSASKKVWVALQSGSSPKPDSIRIKVGCDDSLLNQVALRVVQLIPEWDVYYRRGKFVTRSWSIPIIFSEENRKKYAR